MASPNEAQRASRVDLADPEPIRPEFARRLRAVADPARRYGIKSERRWRKVANLMVAGEGFEPPTKGL